MISSPPPHPTPGWLKNSVADLAADTCDLYIKKSTPQPAADPISFWPLPVSVSFGASSLPVDPALTFTISPASADLSAYAASIKDAVFAHAVGGAVPAW